MAAQGFGERLERALFNYQSQNGRRTYAEIGQAIAEREGRAEPYSAQAISDWINGNRAPGIGAIRAIALTLGVTTDSLIMEGAAPPSRRVAEPAPMEKFKPVPKSAGKKRKAR